MIRDLIGLIYPSVCINCNITLISGEKHLCTKCKIDLPTTDDSFNHANDLLKKFYFNGAVKGAASLLYFYQKGVTQKLLHKLKYDGQNGIGRMLGTYLADKVSELKRVDFIVPVPIHKKKLRKRGYNQSTEIAYGISERLSITVKEDVVKRELMSLSQTRKSKVERWENLANVYGEASDYVRNRKVLIVDDVITTGATIGMLCDRLVEKGVDEIYVGSIARGK